MKKALITGINGQDGSYLAELLLEKGYKVYGFILKTSPLDLILHIKDKLVLIEGDLLDQKSIDAAIEKSQPDEIFHLAAFTAVGASWKNPVLTGNINALGTTRLLESIKKIRPGAKFYNASTSEMFDSTDEIKTEKSSFNLPS